MKRLFKFLAYLIGSIFLLIVGVFLWLYISSSITSKQNMGMLGAEAPILQVDNISFRDLNKNGKLDVYEDSRQSVEARVNDLLNQMNLEEKAGLMFITMTAMGNDGALSETKSIFNPFSIPFLANSEMVVKKKMNHFNTLQSPEPKAMVIWNNNIQKLAERTRLGIPVTLATDPRHGVPNAPGASIYTPYFSKWCSYPGFAAIGDTVLMREFGDIARQEYLAVGYRLTLSPMADLATEPRWWRINGTFGEDAEMSAKLTKAYILGFQGDSISSQSVECMVKHFSGGGPQEDGIDSHFPPGRQAYPGNNFEYHLIPFEKGAFPAKTAQVMPYYGIPMGQTTEDVGFSYNKDIITGLLRDKYHFDGIVCTDWGLVTDQGMLGIGKPASAHGVENLSEIERVKKIIDAGCDMFGGEAIPELVVELVKAGQLSEERINTSVRRILREKFKLGLFDNPYVNEEATSILGNEKFLEKGRESQRRSLVLLKNEQNILPLASSVKVYLQGFSEEDSKKYAGSITSIADADVIILKVNAPYDPEAARYVVEKIFHQGSLEFPLKEKEEMLKLIQSKPTITVINLERPAVFPEINAASKAVIGDFSSQDDIILDLIFGQFKPEAKLPFELPSSMEAVLNQKEDVPHDSKDPLYPFGFGLSYE
ncbi:MAG: glycoside hydrolase family 3 C-terminal domain-containing protein [Cyclobacteriaceae bacterium]|nr:glycoside hydrolase family 3 C-terminal domain-containing protein [Cyclobacteriaceae bacterium]